MWIQRKEELEKEVMLTNDYQDKTIEIKINGRKLIN